MGRLGKVLLMTATAACALGLAASAAADVCDPYSGGCIVLGAAQQQTPTSNPNPFQPTGPGTNEAGVTTAAPASRPGPATAPDLAVTGADIAGLLVLAALLAGVGVALVVATRIRSREVAR